MVLAELAQRVDDAARAEVAALNGPHRAVYLTSRWKGRAVFAVLAAGEVTPSLVIKIDSHPAHKFRLHAEFAALTDLRQHPTMRGRVPGPLALFDVGTYRVLAQTGLPGVPLNVILRRRLRASRRVCGGDQDRVLAWLADLQDTPATIRAPFDGKVALDRMRTTLGGRSVDSRPFLHAMSEQAQRWQDVSLPTTAGHGDLGPSNCLISSSGQVGVIDWEGGVGTRSPLVDILIFLHHYARALPTRQRRAATGAFSRAFLADGWLAELTASNVHRQLRRLGVPPAAAPLLVASTLADLASGEARSAHSLRPGARRYWSACLEAFAAGHERSLLGDLT